MSPSLPKRECTYPGCNVKVRRGRCPTHEQLYVHPESSFYQTPEWKAFRADVLAERPWCECGCGRPSDTVAHDVPVRADRSRALDKSNVRALYHACHSSESAERGERWPRKL